MVDTNMTQEQATIYDYHKGLVDAGICVDVLLTAIEHSHPQLHQHFVNGVPELTDESIIPLLEEIINNGTTNNNQTN
jgi:hypothetical protein